MRAKLQFKSNQKRLSFNVISLIMLIIADIFLSILIFHGLSEQNDQLTNPEEYFPEKHKQVFIYDEWVDNNFVYNITEKVLSEEYSEPYKKHKKMHTVCVLFDKKINEIKGDKELYQQLRNFKRLITKFGGFSKYQKLRGYADPTYQEIQILGRNLRNIEKIDSLINFIKIAQNKSYKEEIKTYKKFFALKRTLFSFAFLVPLIILLILWNQKAFKKNYELSIIISSHFIIISFLPMLFELCRLIFEVLPHVLLKSIYDFLINSKLVTVWYYILIFLSIVIIFLIIWFLQNKIFTQKRFLTRRILANKCTRCGVKVDYEKRFCPNCSNELKSICPNCNQLRIKDYDFCQFCGKKN